MVYNNENNAEIDIVPDFSENEIIFDILQDAYLVISLDDLVILITDSVLAGEKSVGYIQQYHGMMSRKHTMAFLRRFPTKEQRKILHDALQTVHV